MGSNSVPQGSPANTTQAVEAAKAAAVESAAAAALDAKLNAMLGLGVFLNAEELFAFARNQIEGTDLQIRALVKDITLRKEQAAELQKVSAGLREVKNGSYQQQMDKLDELIGQAQQSGTTEGLDKLVKTKQELQNNGGKAFSSDKIEGVAQDVDGMLTKLTSSTELTMIQIQGLMQHRGQILSLASNVMAALAEPVKNAIGNIRSS